jgi:hypothetical protein
VPSARELEPVLAPSRINSLPRFRKRRGLVGPDLSGKTPVQPARHSEPVPASSRMNSLAFDIGAVLWDRIYPGGRRCRRRETEPVPASSRMNSLAFDIGAVLWDRIYPGRRRCRQRIVGACPGLFANEFAPTIWKSARSSETGFIREDVGADNTSAASEGCLKNRISNRSCAPVMALSLYFFHHLKIHEAPVFID